MAELDDDIDELLDEVENKFLTKPVPRARRPACPGAGPPTQTQSTSTDKATSRPTFTPKKPIKFDNTSNIPKGMKGSKKSELDDVLNDLDDIMGPGDAITGKSCSDTNVKKSDGRVGSHGITGQNRCFPVYIGGVACASGQATAVNQRICDRLRCTDCDFEISTFDNLSWHSKTDYLFLRNNMPDFDRLKSKLISKAGYRAYACQCKCRTAKDIMDLKTDQELKWVCGKH